MWRTQWFISKKKEGVARVSKEKQKGGPQEKGGTESRGGKTRSGTPENANGLIAQNPTSEVLAKPRKEIKELTALRC